MLFISHRICNFSMTLLCAPCLTPWRVIKLLFGESCIASSAACFVSIAALSFPCILACPGVHRIQISNPLDLRSSMCSLISWITSIYDLLPNLVVWVLLHFDCQKRSKVWWWYYTVVPVYKIPVPLKLLPPLLWVVLWLVLSPLCIWLHQLHMVPCFPCMTHQFKYVNCWRISEFEKMI